jgi:hypothetical protein
LFPLAGTTAKTLLKNGGWVSSKLPIKTNPGQIQSAVDSPEAVLAYLARYTHRVAISNRRLISADAGGVTFNF